MNRRDVITAVAYYEKVAEVAKERADRLRADLGADARAEYEEQKTVPTWRSDVARVSGSLSRRAVVVDDPDVFGEWTSRRYPTEVESRTVYEIQQAWLKRFLTKGVTVVDGDTVCDGDEVVPGLKVRAGGEFRNVSVVVHPEAKNLLTQLADRHVAQMAVASGLPGLAELEAAPAA